MANTRADRLRKARIGAGYASASVAARSLGVSPSTYIHHENGTRDFGEDAATLYARRYHVTISWLLLGEGEMETEDLALEKQQEADARRQEDEEYKEARAALPASQRAKIREDRERWEQKSAHETIKQLALIPEITPFFKKEDTILTRGWRRYVGLTETVTHPISATWGIPLNHIRYELGCSPETTVLFQIDGNANAPTLAHGDVVFVETSVSDVVADGLYLIADKVGYPQVRRLQTNLYSDPPTITISADGSPDQRMSVELSAMTIVGQVRGRINRL